MYSVFLSYPCPIGEHVIWIAFHIVIQYSCCNLRCLFSLDVVYISVRSKCRKVMTLSLQKGPIFFLNMIKHKKSFFGRDKKCKRSIIRLPTPRKYDFIRLPICSITHKQTQTLLSVRYFDDFLYMGDNNRAWSLYICVLYVYCSFCSIRMPTRVAPLWCLLFLV